MLKGRGQRGRALCSYTDRSKLYWKPPSFPDLPQTPVRLSPPAYEARRGRGGGSQSAIRYLCQDQNSFVFDLQAVLLAVTY